MNTNSLDLNNDILEILGDYVKKDNLDRILKEKDFEFKNYIIGELMWELKDEKISKKKMGKLTYSELLYYSYSEEEIFEYIEITNLTKDCKNYI